MSKPIEDKIVSLKMDISDLKSKASEAISTFGGLNKTIDSVRTVNTRGSIASLGEMQMASEKVDFGALARNIDNISNKFSISTHAISRRIKKLGYSVINYQNLVEYNIEDIKEFIDQGYTLSNIANIYNVSCSAISRFIKINNINLKKSKFDENVFDIIDTEEKAY